jgi:hypothetical protein
MRQNRGVDQAGMRAVRDWDLTGDRDARSRERRAEVLALPMLPLRRHAYLKPPDDLAAPRVAAAVGVGADSVAMAVWPATGRQGVVVTSHQASQASSAGLEVPTSLRAYFVQPLPANRILLVAARTTGEDEHNAEVWSAEGHRERTGLLGDAIEHVLTTASGTVWVGYFDEALGQPGPEGHGLARFTSSLQPEWLYPFGTLPEIDDCYALNVAGEMAYCCAYTSFHLISVAGDRASDHGPAPALGARRLLADGERAALIGGYGPEYDVITPLRITSSSVEPAGPQRRLVLPDGLEIPRPGTRYTCRGPDLHMISKRGTWYRLSLEDLPSGS